MADTNFEIGITLTLTAAVTCHFHALSISMLPNIGLIVFAIGFMNGIYYLVASRVKQSLLIYLYVYMHV